MIPGIEISARENSQSSLDESPNSMASQMPIETIEIPGSIEQDTVQVETPGLMAPLSTEKLVDDAEKAKETAASLRINLETSQTTPGGKAADTRRELLSFLREKFSETNVDIYSDGEFVVVRLPAATYRLGATRVPVGIKEQLAPIVEAVTRFGDRVDLLVEGHSDASQPRSGSRKTNYDMAYARADGIARQLTAMGVDVENMGILSRSSGLLADSENPRSDNNRRVELVFSPKRGAKSVSGSVASQTVLESTVAPTADSDATGGVVRIESNDLESSAILEAAASSAEGDSQVPTAVDADGSLRESKLLDRTSSENSAVDKEVSISEEIDAAPKIADLRSEPTSSESVSGTVKQGAPTMAPGPLHDGLLPEPAEIIIDLPVIAIERSSY